MGQTNDGWMRAATPRYSIAAGMTFLAFTAFFGAIVHVLSEASGLAWSAPDAGAFWQRHEYLAGVMMAAIVCLLVGVRLLPSGERRTRIGALIRKLPFKGQGTGFAATAFAAQFAFCAVTQLAEGNPLSRGDLLTGVLAGVVAAAFGALIVSFCKQRILRVALALVCATHRAAVGRGTVNVITACRGPIARATRRPPFSFRYRPPPLVV